MFVHRAPHSLKFKLACHASYARQKSLKPTFHGIARIHKKLFTSRLLRRIHGFKITAVNVDFAAHFEHGRYIALQAMRHGLDRAHIGGDVLAFFAIAAGRRDSQFAVFITQRTGQPVDFRLGSEMQLRRIGVAEKALHARDEILKLLPGVDAALVSPDGYNAAVLASPEAARLKIISRWGVGYDSIDIPAATKQGIVVAYTPGMLDDTVADYTWALLLGIARRIHEGHMGMAAGKWAPAWGHDVFGKTLGVIGCGRIGQAVVRRAAGFNLRVLSYDVASNPNAEKLGVRFVPLDELLEQSDFVTLHAASTPQNRGMLGEAQFRKMKRSAYLINAGRGALIDEAALVRLMKAGRLTALALDAFDTVPLPPDHPLRELPRTILTPTIVGHTQETTASMPVAAVTGAGRSMVSIGSANTTLASSFGEKRIFF